MRRNLRRTEGLRRSTCPSFALGGVVKAQPWIRQWIFKVFRIAFWSESIIMHPFGQRPLFSFDGWAPCMHGHLVHHPQAFILIRTRRHGVEQQGCADFRLHCDVPLCTSAEILWLVGCIQPVFICRGWKGCLTTHGNVCKLEHLQPRYFDKPKSVKQGKACEQDQNFKLMPPARDLGRHGCSIKDAAIPMKAACVSLWA
jgi:hypothetical protein